MDRIVTLTTDLPPWLARILAHPAPHVMFGGVVLLLDLLTGPYLQFPILFVIPVCLAAWFDQPRLAYALALLLPLGRSAIAYGVDQPSPLPFIAANAAVRMLVLGLLAFLVVRMAQHARALRARVTDLARMCAWSRTVEYQGEWLSFEEYLKRRFNVQTTHGIAPDQSERLLEALRKNAPQE
jgi:hypothetical protein